MDISRSSKMQRLSASLDDAVLEALRISPHHWTYNDMLTLFPGFRVTRVDLKFSRSSNMQRNDYHFVWILRGWRNREHLQIIA